MYSEKKKPRGKALVKMQENVSAWEQIKVEQGALSVECEKV